MFSCFSYLNHPVASSRCEALLPQNADAGVKSLRIVWEWGLHLLAAEAHLWINVMIVIIFIMLEISSTVVVIAIT